MTHIPVLRAGKPYASLDVQEVPHVQTGEPLVRVSQANPGLIARDLSAAKANKGALDALSVSDLAAITRRAGRLFAEADLPLDGHTQSPGDYVRQVSGTTGIPETLCRENMGKISLACSQIDEIHAGLTRELDLSVLDRGWDAENGRPLSYVCQTDALGAVLPSNSPGVHSLWVPAVSLKVPLVLKPGREDPWTPFRIAQAFLAAGCPGEAFGIFPTGHAGANEILLRCGRSLLFGGGATVAPWLHDPRVSVHGPGRSKVILGEDLVDRWEDFLDVILDSISANGGRSCINASGVWTPAHGREIAGAIAHRLARIEARPLSDPHARIAAFSNPAAAAGISNVIDVQLKAGGAVDLTADLRGSRLVERDGLTFLNPTLVWCESPEHPLANTEYLFPYSSVVEVPQAEAVHRIGPSLVVTVLTEDEGLVGELLNSPHVDRLNAGPIPTNRISWDQPHEGNLFDHLYRQRAFQYAQGA
ncbi:MAG: aldehyde dehydrogenase family protein [Gemmatimonadota bacterium]|nr:aldehyde dehydrogenase family protein [Gemmatimonadota bacterium]